MKHYKNLTAVSFLAAICAWLYLGDRGVEAVTPQTSFQRQSVAVNLLRAINMAEEEYRTSTGAFAPWSDLVRSRELLAAKTIYARTEPELLGVKFTSGGEVLPGWNLRLNISGMHDHYNLILQDVTDKQCASALFTDEQYFIWKGEAVSCP
jgi:hypothetical protein